MKASTCPLPAASLNNPRLSVHSGVCGSASYLSPEAVDIKREMEPSVLNQDLLSIKGQKNITTGTEETGHASKVLTRCSDEAMA